MEVSVTEFFTYEVGRVDVYVVFWVNEDGDEYRTQGATLREAAETAMRGEYTRQVVR